MKLSIFLVMITATVCCSQYNEFTIHNNGLIYDETTMNRLGSIVDSLNLRFRTCDLSHPYFSVPQGLATLVDVRSKEVRKLMETGMPFEDFALKYPRSIKKKNIWMVKTRYTNYDDYHYIRYEGLPTDYQNKVSISVKDKKANDKTTGWIISEEGDEALYLQGLHTSQLPYDYARLVQYVDCMIDTNASIYFEGAEAQVYERVKEDSKAHQFISWAETYPGEPTFDYEKINEMADPDSVYDVYVVRHRLWDSLRLLHVDDLMKTSHYWKSVLMDAVEESLERKNSDARLEFYVARYLSSADALKLKRSRKVMGGCSQDQSPRYHAMDICKLAAETTQWDIFLRSHLDIMNDRFERISDGSYAWAGRKTYLKELEELDIPAVDLLLGTTLRVQNVSNNHYFGSINRTGRALADTEDKDALEKRLAAMIQNDQLDPYNRVLLVYLFDNYVYNLDDEARKTSGIQTLSNLINTLPDYMREVVKGIQE
jgi:hypothetical protein